MPLKHQLLILRSKKAALYIEPRFRRNLMTKSLLVSGATGYVGRNLIKALQKDGYEVSSLSEGHQAAYGKAWRLGDRCSTEYFDEFDCFVHLAHCWEDPELNLNGTQTLLESFRRSRCKRFVFASTLSASPVTTSKYGTVKYSTEQLLIGPDEKILRIGLVYGGINAGMWEQVKRLAVLPIVPVLGADQPVHPISMADLVKAIKQTAFGVKVKKLNYACNSSSISFDDFLRLTAAADGGKTPSQIRIPNRLLVFIEKFFGWAIPTNVRDRIRGILNLAPIPKGEGLETLNIIEEPLFNRNQQLRLNLLREGHCLLTYITGIQPSLASLRCYYKTVIKHYGGIPGRFCLIPFRIRTLGLLLEPFRGTSDLTSLSKRLELAYQIASLQSNSRFSFYASQDNFGFFRTIAFFWALKLEALAVGIRFLVKVLWRR